MFNRFIHILKYILIFLFLGIVYDIVLEHTKFAIPCPIYTITGLKCPGCGVTHLCIALLHLDFKGAYQSNQMLFIISPFLMGVLIKYVFDYIRTGQWKMSRIQNAILYIAIVLLIIFGIWRNIYN